MRGVNVLCRRGGGGGGGNPRRQVPQLETFTNFTGDTALDAPFLPHPDKI